LGADEPPSIDIKRGGPFGVEPPSDMDVNRAPVEGIALGLENEVFHPVSDGLVFCGASIGVNDVNLGVVAA
jgi:hypothetical protein